MGPSDRVHEVLLLNSCSVEYVVTSCVSHLDKACAILPPSYPLSIVCLSVSFSEYLDAPPQS